MGHTKKIFNNLIMTMYSKKGKETREFEQKELKLIKKQLNLNYVSHFIFGMCYFKFKITSLSRFSKLCECVGRRKIT